MTAHTHESRLRQMHKVTVVNKHIKAVLDKSAVHRYHGHAVDKIPHTSSAKSHIVKVHTPKVVKPKATKKKK